MKLIYFGLLPLFIFLFPETINVIPIGGIDLSELNYNNESLSSPRSDNASIEVLVLHGATLIDGTGSPPKAGTDIIISGNKIVAVTNQTGFLDNFYTNDFNRMQARVSFLNLSGKYVMPGLFDMHAHVAGVLKDSYDQDTSRKMLRMLLDNGITTIRNPGGPANESISLRQDVHDGKIVGPEIFTAGRLLNTPEFPIPFVERHVTTDKEVVEEVRGQASLGVDFIKLYVGLDPKLLKVAIDEAHRQGVKVIGHLHLTSWTEAAKLGIDFLTHGVPVSPSLLSEEKRRMFNQSGGGPFSHSLWLDLVDLDSTEIRNMIDSLVKNQIPVDPTLNVYEAVFMESFHDPHNTQRWNKVLQLTKMMHESGVKILSGTDIPNFGFVPGESLHHELKLLVDAGIKPMDVIKIATKNGAEALDIINQTGTIEPGKQADILILSANPLEDIENVKRVETIISNGKVIGKSINDND
jgi:imidazolonepropionase-like amidohydrolase